MELTCSTKATFAILKPSIEAQAKEGVIFLYKIITFARSPKYNIREVLSFLDMTTRCL